MNVLLIGSGGGGASGVYTTYGTGGNGGSGIVIISYPNTYRLAVTTGSPVFTNIGGNYIYKFNASGTISF